MVLLQSLAPARAKEAIAMTDILEGLDTCYFHSVNCLLCANKTKRKLQKKAKNQLQRAFILQQRNVIDIFPFLLLRYLTICIKNFKTDYALVLFHTDLWMQRYQEVLYGILTSSFGKEVLLAFNMPTSAKRQRKKRTFNSCSNCHQVYHMISLRERPTRQVSYPLLTFNSPTLRFSARF